MADHLEKRVSNLPIGVKSRHKKRVTQIKKIVARGREDLKSATSKG